MWALFWNRLAEIFFSKSWPPFNNGFLESPCCAGESAMNLTLCIFPPLPPGWKNWRLLPSFVFPHFTTFWSSSANLCQWEKININLTRRWFDGILPVSFYIKRLQPEYRRCHCSLSGKGEGGQIPIWAIFAWKQPFLGETGLDFRRMAWQRRLSAIKLLSSGVNFFYPACPLGQDPEETPN